MGNLTSAQLKNLTNEQLERLGKFTLPNSDDRTNNDEWDQNLQNPDKFLDKMGEVLSLLVQK